MNFTDLTFMDFTEFTTIMSIACSIIVLLYTRDDA